MDQYDKGYDINKPNKLKMAMKKPTKSDIKAGRVYRCGNCDALCTNVISIKGDTFVMGRPQHKFTTYYCDLACAYKHSRDRQRPQLEGRIKYLKGAEQTLKDMLQFYIEQKKKSKTLFQAIKMIRQEIKSRTMLLSGESTLDIMKVEFFKLSEAAMELAELVAEEEDPLFNECAKDEDEEFDIGPVTETDAQNLAMSARSMSGNKYQQLSTWFN